MGERADPLFRDAFAAETRRVLAQRVPVGVGFYVVLVVLAGLLEVTHFPGRVTPLVTTFAAEILLGLVAIAVARSARLRRYVVPIVTCTTLGIALLVTLYVWLVSASGEALAFAVIVFLTGVALLFPWGLIGQVPVALGTLGGYLLALAGGVRGELPWAYGVLSVLGGAATSLVGAHFLDLHRRAILRQRMLLERTRDQQMAILYDVTRTVTATLDLQQVLRLVCQGVLHALKLDRLWLFWREGPTGDVRALKAETNGDQITVLDLCAERVAWETLLEGAGDTAPQLVEPGAAEAAALGVVDPAPALLLRLPLLFQSDLVGTILADCGATARPIETSFLDFAATLGNSAAMAIANARLHALVLHHRAELQQMSNKRLDVAEEGLRHLSRELHDGTCQALMAIKLDLSLLERQLPPEAEGFHAAVCDLRAQVLDVAHGVRQMSHLLRPPALDDFGATAAIESLAEKYRGGSDLDVRFESATRSLRFPPPIELLVFRAFQEALINVTKHAGATRVQVRLAYEDGALVLEIRDNGRGFDARAYFRSPPTSVGLGLIGMRERVAHFGGVFQVTSRVGTGTRLFVSVPAEPIGTARLAAAV